MNTNRMRILRGNLNRPNGVIYWMSRDQRSYDNWALLYAQHQALYLQVPLQVVFVLLPEFLLAQSKQYTFMLRGLQEVATDLVTKNIPFRMLSGDPCCQLVEYLNENTHSLLVTDFDPLRIKREWKAEIIKKTTNAVHEVDAHNIVPCWEASARLEIGAYTLRPKIHRQLPFYLETYPKLIRHPFSSKQSSFIPDWGKLFKLYETKPHEINTWPTGQTVAINVMNTFINGKLLQYEKSKNDPTLNGQSSLSPYIHFGQLSTQRIFLEIIATGTNSPSHQSFLEELVVRRELADNYCYYNINYDNIKGFPVWAQKTLEDHLYDKRPYLYDKDTLEFGVTHDPAWNRAQKELTTTGKMHGYMRMYWGKKILEWSNDPGSAMQTAIYLNDHYSLDGRDPNGYAGIAWCIGGVHDRAWGERAIFGKIRYMNFAGLRRKFKIENYINRNDQI